MEEIKNTRLKTDALPQIIDIHQIGQVEQYP
jgi:hypothetical protein